MRTSISLVLVISQRPRVMKSESFMSSTLVVAAAILLRDRGLASGARHTGARRDGPAGRRCARAVNRERGDGGWISGHGRTMSPSLRILTQIEADVRILLTRKDVWLLDRRHTRQHNETHNELSA